MERALQLRIMILTTLPIHYREALVVGMSKVYSLYFSTEEGCAEALCLTRLRFKEGVTRLCTPWIISHASRVHLPRLPW